MTHKTRWTLEELTRRLALIEPLVCRRSGLGGGGEDVITAGALPPYSVTALRRVDGAQAPTANEFTVTPDLLENAALRIELNADGDIVRIFDKVAGPEMLPPRAVANQFQTFEDRPLNWDAWDIDVCYDDRMWTAEPATAVRDAGDRAARAEQPLHAAHFAERRQRAAGL